MHPSAGERTALLDKPPGCCWGCVVHHSWRCSAAHTTHRFAWLCASVWVCGKAEAIFAAHKQQISLSFEQNAFSFGAALSQLKSLLADFILLLCRQSAGWKPREEITFCCFACSCEREFYSENRCHWVLTLFSDFIFSPTRHVGTQRRFWITSRLLLKHFLSSEFHLRRTISAVHVKNMLKSF